MPAGLRADLQGADVPSPGVGAGVVTIVSYQGGPITHRSLMNKSKHELASMYLQLLENRWRFAKAAYAAGLRVTAEGEYADDEIGAWFEKWASE